MTSLGRPAPHDRARLRQAERAQNPSTNGWRAAVFASGRVLYLSEMRSPEDNETAQKAVETLVGLYPLKVFVNGRVGKCANVSKRPHLRRIQRACDRSCGGKRITRCPTRPQSRPELERLLKLYCDSTSMAECTLSWMRRYKRRQSVALIRYAGLHNAAEAPGKVAHLSWFSALVRTRRSSKVYPREDGDE